MFYRSRSFSILATLEQGSKLIHLSCDRINACFYKELIFDCVNVGIGVWATEGSGSMLGVGCMACLLRAKQWGVGYKLTLVSLDALKGTVLSSLEVMEVVAMWVPPFEALEYAVLL